MIKVCYPNHEFKISYLTIFSQSDNDFQSLRSKMQQMGEESEAKNGYKYKLGSPIQYSGEKIDLIRIRRPDIHRKEYEMIELSDFKINVYAYLVKNL